LVHTGKLSRNKYTEGRGRLFTPASAKGSYKYGKGTGQNEPAILDLNWT
jgi:hypothetical protein